MSAKQPTKSRKKQPANVGCGASTCSRLMEARDIIRKLLSALPTVHCADFHHGKKDQHGWHEPCPVVERWRKEIKRAEDFVSSAPTCSLNQPEIMKDIESQAMEYAEALNDIADVLNMPTGATAAEIVQKARDRWANGIHTCHERCTRERCVERRKLKAMREALEAANECLALIEDVGHGAMMGNVSVTRGIVLRALDSENDQAQRP